jgi:DNA-binding SARP family transcriptional activator
VNIQELGLCNKLQSTWVENLRQSYNARNTINQSSSGFLDTGLSSKLLHISQKFQQEPFDEKVYEQLTETYQINLSFQDFLEFNKGLTLRDQNYFTLHYLCSHAEAGPIQ